MAQQGSHSFGRMQEWNGIPGQWWFGGGTDITPSYVNEEDMRHFHGTYKVGPAVGRLPHIRRNVGALQNPWLELTAYLAFSTLC